MAHEKGEVRLYQFSPLAQEVTSWHMEASSRWASSYCPGRQWNLFTTFQSINAMVTLRLSLHDVPRTASSCDTAEGVSLGG